MQSFRNIIAIWSGAIVGIPANWHLCDGTNGTPDLRDVFVQGSQGALAIGDIGGNTSHTHAFTSDGHAHDWSLGSGLLFGDGFLRYVSQEQDSGTTNPNAATTIYYALAFIMRVS